MVYRMSTIDFSYTCQQLTSFVHLMYIPYTFTCILQLSELRYGLLSYALSQISRLKSEVFY